MGKALSGSGWPAEEHAASMAIENGVRLRVSALLKTITSFLDLEVPELLMAKLGKEKRQQFVSAYQL